MLFPYVHLYLITITVPGVLLFEGDDPGTQAQQPSFLVLCAPCAGRRAGVEWGMWLGPGAWPCLPPSLPKLGPRMAWSLAMQRNGRWKLSILVSGVQ